ncbi:MAG TPA: Asp-tRNA(Asn)/Glu-tRNA(Gln) amidotransferase GatCAB subunit B, partial [Anaerolineales bacterium]|nr:Asp-tRNA(Asn)/Glu-tRNA(Gln) amidotransferase GatCAB subunit B [Anaerolineales bacterium]
EDLKAAAAPKAAANWITGELFRLMNTSGQSIDQVKMAPRALAKLIDLLGTGSINSNTAKIVFEEMFATGQDAGAIVAARGLGQVSDTAEIEAQIDRV